MKSVELKDARQSLGDCARHLEEPRVVTKNGKPLVAVVPVDELDMESLSLSSNPEFLALLEHSRARYRAEGGIPETVMRKRLGLPPAKRRPGKRG